MRRFCEKLTVVFSSGKTLEIPVAANVCAVEKTAGEYRGHFSMTEQELSHIFTLADRENRVYRCLYCETKAK